MTDGFDEPERDESDSSDNESCSTDSEVRERIYATMKKHFSKKGKNPLGKDGKMYECHGCGSTEHLIADCPKKPPHSYKTHAAASSSHQHTSSRSKKPQKPQRNDKGRKTHFAAIMLPQFDVRDFESIKPTLKSAAIFNSTELQGKAGIMPDSGAKVNVVGARWLKRAEKNYLKAQGKKVQYYKSNPCTFTGVGGATEQSNTRAKMPIFLGNKWGIFDCQVLPDSDLPALWGLESLRRSEAILDLGKGNVILPGDGEVTFTLSDGAQKIPMERSCSGHYIMPTTGIYQCCINTDGSHPDASIYDEPAKDVYISEQTKTAPAATPKPATVEPEVCVPEPSCIHWTEAIIKNIAKAKADMSTPRTTELSTPKIVWEPAQKWEFWQWGGCGDETTTSLTDFRVGPYIGPSSGWQLQRRQHQLRLLQVLREHPPKILWLQPANPPSQIGEKLKRYYAFLEEAGRTQLANGNHLVVVGAKRTPVWDVASISALTQLPQMNPHELDWCRIPIIDPESQRPWMRTTSYHSSLHMPELKQVCRCPPGVEHQWLIGRIKDIDVDRKALGNHVPPGVLQLQATALRRHAGSPSKVNSESKSSDFADSNSNDLMKPDDQNEQPTPIDPNIMTPPAAEVETQKMPKQGRHASDFGESTSKRSKAENFDLAADDEDANAAVDIPVDMDDADILHVNQPKPKVLATQICGGMGNLLIQLQKLHIKTGVNADRCTGWELHLNEHKTNLKQQITDDVPLFLACSFPCKYHGGWTNFNSWRDPEGYTKPKEYARRLSRWCGKRCLEQLDKGLELFVEHSGTSDIMHDDLWKRVLDHPRVTAFRAPMCAHDLICPEGEPILKMSWFITTSPEVRTALKRDCPGHERHKEISGFCQGYKLSTWTQTWTPTFNKRLAKAMIATARRRNELESVAKSSFVGAFTCPKCTGADKDAKHSAIPGQCRIANLRSFDYRAHRMPAPASSTGATAGSTEAPELEMPDMPPPPAPVAPAEPSSSSKSHKRTLPTETADRSKRPGRKSPKALDQVPEGEEVPGEKPVGGLGYAPGGIIPAGGHRVVDKPDSMEERQILDAVSEADMLDMPKVLKNVFKLRDAKLIRKAILRWHKRSYHMPERNMKLMFDRSGAPERITQELSVAVRSCPQCRLWAVPDRRPVIRASLRWQFNESVQMDLVFIELRGEMKVAMHVICEGTRYALAWEINSKETMELMESFIIHWFKVFGPPVQVVADQEGGWANDAFGSFLSRHRVRRVLLPKGDHAWSIERRNDTLRRVIQRTDSDLQQQGITLSFKHLVSEASFVCNAILENGGYSVYTSVFGKQPRLCLLLANEAELSCAEVDDQGLSLEEPGILSATCRMREAALKAGLAELSQQRLEASERHNATRTDQDRPYTVGEMVDVYREHEHKGISGWRGPARVTDPDLTKGQVAVRWQGKVIPAPLRWIRPHVYLLMQGPDFQRFMM